MNSHSISPLRIRALVIKETWHIMRDWQTLIIIIALPVLMMFLYGYALTLDISDLPVLIEDPSGSSVVRDIGRNIDASQTFKVLGYVYSANNVEEVFKTWHVKAIFRFAPDFDKDVRNGGTPAPIQVLIDGTDPNQGTLIRNLAEPLMQKAAFGILGIKPQASINVVPDVLYNPEQKSSLFFVPGLMAIILIMIPAMLTSLTLTREKELGTLEQLLISPLKPIEIIIGKILAYVAIAAIDGGLMLFVGQVWFGVSCAGNYAFLILSCLVYILVSLALGLIFSTVAKTQQQAMLLVIPITMLSTIMLSGFIFPIASMPQALQWLANIMPATYFLLLIRGIMLKGVGIVELWQPLCILSGMGFLFLILSIRNLKAKL